MKAEILVGDVLVRIKDIADNSVDSIVTDPPYEIGFMGKVWDSSKIAYSMPMWSECLRVLKPGGYLLSFGGSRTYHRMACAIEDAGFEVRDQIMWIYGSGFPKSKNLKGDWKGWGTALKPAHEPIVVARKPFKGTVEANVLEFGTGALNIDGCRIATQDGLGGGAEKETTKDQKGNEGWTRPWMDDPAAREAHSATIRKNVEHAEDLGRWPANVIHDGSEEVLDCFPNTSSGAMRAGTVITAQDHTESVCYGTYGGKATDVGTFGDSGSAARFFYTAKANKTDREKGCASLENQALAYGNQAQAEVKRGNLEHAGKSGMNTVKMRANNHPTVKPTDLMCYLTRLVTPLGGTVLDPFTGSGSTGIAAMREGFNFIGIELSAEYATIAERRISFESPMFNEVSVPQRVDPALPQEQHVLPGVLEQR